MKLFSPLFAILYRIWFYILVTVPILLMLPFLVVATLKQQWYPAFFKMARVWATIILYGMGCVPVITKKITYVKGNSYMFVSNHTSMLDIMLMLYCVKNPFVFVGKMELAKIPLFGFFYKRTCILVDRSNSKSRREVFNSAQQRINQGLSICIFPEGGVPDDLTIVLDTFKDGAFRLAIEHQLPIAPMTFHDNKKRFPFVFLKGTPGKVRATLHPLISTTGLVIEEKRKVKETTRQMILQELLAK